jgi:signal transduction histidine kinase
MPSKAINLRLKFITGLVMFATALGVCISVIMYFHYNSIMESEISQRSHMLLAQSDAVQDYVKTVLRPQMFDTLPEDRFIRQAMSSSYISRQVMTRLGIKEDSDYLYRRVAIKPRNPASAPNAFEAGLITSFNDNRALSTWEDTTEVNGREYHMVARPVTFSKSCLQCHGDPEDAPKELIEIYGSHSGFHYVENEVGGVVVAGFPVALIKTPARELTLQYLSLYLLGIIFFAGLISLFFDRLVMKNLHHLAYIFKTRFSGQQEQSIIERLGKKDEIEGLVEGVDELAACLSEARNELEDYAQNLEIMVQDRTKALDLKARKHLGDVRLFVSLLSGFASSQNTRQLISGLLDSVGKRYNADQAVYHCTVVSENIYAWKPEKPAAQSVSNEIKELLWKDDIRMDGNQVFIPVKSPESHWGILNLSWEKGPAPDDLDPAILLALGQQVAILIENIHAFSNIRFQHDMLQSVFKGICDPLLLIDEDYHIIIANDGADGILGQGTRREREKRLRSLICDGPAESSGCSLLEQVIASGRAVKHEAHTPDQRFFDVELYPIASQDKTKTRMVLYARDITLEKEMLDRMQQAERLSAIGKMAAGIAHEINNPLGVIQVYADLVKDAVDDPDTGQDVDVILKHTSSAKNVVQNLLNLARPKKSLSGTCSLNRVIRSELEVFKAQAQARQIRLETQLTPDLPQVQCNIAIVEQILTNLWINAVDALQEGGGDRICLITDLAEDKEICLTIEDNGPGIKNEILDQIFDPFFSTKAVGKGTGLGLSVVYGFVTELGGRITVDNIPLTRFNIFFPTADRSIQQWPEEQS